MGPIGLAFEIVQDIRSSDTTFGSRLSPLILLLLLIPYLPISYRKFLLNSCRIQSVQSRNIALSAEYSLLPGVDSNILNIPTYIINILRLNGAIVSHSSANAGVELRFTTISSSTLVDLFTQIYHSPALCTILSYFVRAEVSVFPEEYMTAKNDGILKELLASQALGRSQQLDYRAYFTDIMHKVHTESDLAPYRTARLWRQHLNRMRDLHTVVFNELHITILSTYDPLGSVATNVRIHIRRTRGSSCQ